MRYRGGFRFSPEYLRQRLGIVGYLYGVELEPHTSSVVLWCHDAQSDCIVREGEIAPIVSTNRHDTRIRDAVIPDKDLWMTVEAWESTRQAVNILLSKRYVLILDQVAFLSASREVAIMRITRAIYHLLGLSA